MRALGMHKLQYNAEVARIDTHNLSQMDAHTYLYYLHGQYEIYQKSLTPFSTNSFGERESPIYRINNQNKITQGLHDIGNTMRAMR